LPENPFLQAPTPKERSGHNYLLRVIDGCSFLAMADLTVESGSPVRREDGNGQSFLKSAAINNLGTVGFHRFVNHSQVILIQFTF
jgi:hypothetical protein